MMREEAVELGVPIVLQIGQSLLLIPSFGGLWEKQISEFVLPLSHSHP
jgi:hypothetical protein